MKALYELREKLCDELKEYGNKELSAGSLSTIDSLAHAVKNIDKIIESCETEGHSHQGRVYRNSRDGMVMDGRSYRRGRDAMGRYVSRDGYSYDDEMIAELRELMNDAHDERTKQEFKKFISKIEAL